MPADNDDTLMLSEINESQKPYVYDLMVALALAFRMYLQKSSTPEDFLMNIKRIADDIDISKLQGDDEAQFKKDMGIEGMSKSMIRLADHYDSIGKIDNANMIDHILEHLMSERGL
jgi:hypothetical protein